jgi:hypothetical protein
MPELFYTIQMIHNRTQEVIPLLMVAPPGIWRSPASSPPDSVSGGTRPGAQRTPLGGKQRPQQPSNQSSRQPQPQRRPFMPSSQSAISPSPASKYLGRHGAGRCVAGDPPGHGDGDPRPSGSGKSTLLRHKSPRTRWGFIQIDGDYIGYRRKGDKLMRKKGDSSPADQRRLRVPEL